MVKRNPTSGQEPQIVEMPPQNMAVVCSKGDPNEVGSQVMPALYDRGLAVWDSGTNTSCGGPSAQRCRQYSGCTILSLVTDMRSLEYMRKSISRRPRQGNYAR